MKSLLKVIFSLVFPLVALAQEHAVPGELAGIWKGKIITTDKHIPYEIAISEKDGKLTGYSYTTYTVNAVEMVAVRTLLIKVEDGNIITEDESLLFDNFDKSSAKQIKQTNTLVLKTQGDMMTLTGNFSTKKTKDLRPATGEITLQKEADIRQTQMAAKLDEMKLLSDMSFVQPVEERILLIKKITAAAPLSPGVKKPSFIAVSRVRAPQILFPPIIHEPAIAVAKAEPKKPVVEKPAVPAKAIAVVQPAKKPASIPKETVQVAVKPQKPAPVAAAKPAAAVAAVPKAAISPAVVETKPAAPAPAPVFTAALAKREIETIQTVYFKTDSLILTLYDNGTVDGDTVSVILDGRMILSKQGLSTNAVNKTINIPAGTGDSMQLVMYAENLGSIPPNTGLLIIKDGSDRYEIRFAGDLEKNAAIILKRRK